MIRTQARFRDLDDIQIAWDRAKKARDEARAKADRMDGKMQALVREARLCGYVEAADALQAEA